MRLLSLLLLGMSSVVTAAAITPTISLQRRDLDTIKAAISQVQDSLNGLDTAVKALSTDPATAGPVLTMSEKVKATIKSATTDISGTSGVSLFQAFSLQSSAKGLTTAVQTTVGDLAAKKPVLDKLGVTSIAVMTLQQQKTDSAALGDAIVSKVPSFGQGIAQSSVKKVNDAIDSAISTLMQPAAPAANTTTASTTPVTPAASTSNNATAEASAAGKSNTNATKLVQGTVSLRGRRTARRVPAAFARPVPVW
jgi:hypothetical protein